MDAFDEDALDVGGLGWAGAPDDVRAITEGGDSIGHGAVDFLALKHGDVFCPLFSAFGPEPIRARLDGYGITPIADSTPASTAAHIDSEIARWGKAFQLSGAPQQ